MVCGLETSVGGLRDKWRKFGEESAEMQDKTRLNVAGFHHRFSGITHRRGAEKI
jgi:hypothetical protein